MHRDANIIEPSEYEDYSRHILSYVGPDTNLFESDHVEKNRRRDHNNLRYGSEETDDDPRGYHSEKNLGFVGSEDNDPRGIADEPNMESFRAQAAERTKFLRMDADPLYSIIDGPRSERRLMKDEETGRSGTAARLKIFDRQLETAAKSSRIISPIQNRGAAELLHHSAERKNNLSSRIVHGSDKNSPPLEHFEIKKDQSRIGKNSAGGIFSSPVQNRDVEVIFSSGGRAENKTKSGIIFRRERPKGVHFFGTESGNTPNRTNLIPIADNPRLRHGSADKFGSKEINSRDQSRNSNPRLKSGLRNVRSANEILFSDELSAKSGRRAQSGPQIDPNSRGEIEKIHYPVGEFSSKTSRGGGVPTSKNELPLRDPHDSRFGRSAEGETPRVKIQSGGFNSSWSYDIRDGRSDENKNSVGILPGEKNRDTVISTGAIFGVDPSVPTNIISANSGIAGLKNKSSAALHQNIYSDLLPNRDW